MVPPLDIFAATDGQPQWLGCADTMGHALVFAQRHGEGLYFVFSQETGHKEFYRINKEGAIQRAYIEGAG